MKHVFLIDGSGFIFRAFHGLPPMSRPDGTPVNAVYGFVMMLMKLVEETDADHIAVLFDRARKTFRNDIYPDYKANRAEPPEDLIPQFALVRDATRAMGLPAVDMDGFEADDLIATYTRIALERDADVTIVSSDKDLMQLVGPRVNMMDAMKNRLIGPDEVREKFGLGPDKVVDIQALAGDSSDNIPGVRGIGVKTAAQLIEQFGDLDGVLAGAESIPQPKRRQSLIEQADMARLSRRLVTLRDDIPVDVDIDSFDVREPNAPALLKFLEAQNFRSLAAKVKSRGVHPHGKPKEVSPATGDVGGKPSAAPIAEEGPGRNYELIQDIETLKRWIAEAEEKGVVAVDCETTSLDVMRAEIVGVSLAYEEGRACYIPLAHKGAPDQGALDFGAGDAPATGAPKQIPRDLALAQLKMLLEDDGVLKVGQNIKYDMHIFQKYDISIAPYDDTMVLSFVLEGGLHGHGMDELARLHLGLETIKFKDVAGSGKAQVTFDRVALDKAVEYAAEDADVTLRLFGLLKGRLVHERLVSVYETLERPLVTVLKDMERHGVLVDAVQLKDLSDDFTARIGDLEREIHALAGHEFNVASPKQLGEILFDEMGLAGAKKGKTGAYGTGAEVLEELAAQDVKIAAKVLDWRQLAKLKSTYTDALIKQIDPATGRVHTSFAMAATSTGRLASSDPNVQNIPVRTEEGRKIRRAFIAKPGHKLLSADYSQIELRLLAHVADIDALKDAFAKGQDVHAMTAAQVFGVPLEGMDPMVRRQAKAINFGIIYGISAFGLARQLGISRPEAARYIDAYFERYPGIRAYMDETKAAARRDGYVTTLFGRRCHVAGINEKNPARRNFAERAAINAPIQGGAADIIKRAMIHLPGALARAGLKAVSILQVHDELILEVPDNECDDATALVRAVMENAAHLEVPLLVDVGLGYNWEQAH
ncbi:DNA polymerase I [Varunaivibrio sulfuroxidans]|uniref:DNA polymerase I n=1 Tax=Varunaivibrio sulfuroxidans TaxID=1773489 RepID=A0A4R3JE13_9PROT|nr:DNA polymerase I [Varunaivibrio sulfuroxidans]TCS63675.1 DNA polymerase I [Varunaivibrio sulfuroxidans]WES30190.1 DNA polymerase I [Varunaivibrio sulfuroxidans]